MISSVYCIKDKVAEECGPLFPAVNDGIARRSFLNLLKDVPAYDRDAFCLVRIGTYDSKEGVLCSCIPELVEIDFPKFDEVETRFKGDRV